MGEQHLSLYSRVGRWLYDAAVDAWWTAWDVFWCALSDVFDPDHQRDERSRERNDSIHEIDAGGNFYAAGCGSDGD